MLGPQNSRQLLTGTPGDVKVNGPATPAEQMDVLVLQAMGFTGWLPPGKTGWAGLTEGQDAKASGQQSPYSQHELSQEQLFWAS